MAELADAQDLGSCEEIRVGSTPTTRTINAVGLSQQRFHFLYVHIAKAKKTV